MIAGPQGIDGGTIGRTQISTEFAEVTPMRFLTHGVTAILALLIGLGVGYYLWQRRAADLAEQLQQQRSEYEYRLSEQTKRAKAAEDQARQEADTRKVLEAELNRIRPQK